MKDLLRLGGILAVLALAALAFVYLEQRKGYGLKVGEPAPAFRVRGLDGGELTLAGVKGRVALVNLWASWCPPCITEMPSLERLHRRFQPEGLVVIGVSVDKEDAEARKVVVDGGLTFAIARDADGIVANAYRTTGFPETYLVDRNGVLRETFIGPVDWDSPEVVARLRSVLDQRASS
jgi:cytochrome c biogenesis protein CcmG, thiol:disulfide interchange protein DsbE